MTLFILILSTSQLFFPLHFISFESFKKSLPVILCSFTVLLFVKRSWLSETHSILKNTFFSLWASLAHTVLQYTRLTQYNFLNENSFKNTVHSLYFFITRRRNIIAYLTKFTFVGRFFSLFDCFPDYSNMLMEKENIFSYFLFLHVFSTCSTLLSTKLHTIALHLYKCPCIFVL